MDVNRFHTTIRIFLMNRISDFPLPSSISARTALFNRIAGTLLLFCASVPGQVIGAPLYLNEGSVEIHRPSEDRLRPLGSESRLVLIQAYIDRAREVPGLRSSVKSILGSFNGFSSIEREALTLIYRAHVEMDPSRGQSSLEKAYGTMQGKAHSDLDKKAVNLLVVHARLLRFQRNSSGYSSLAPDCSSLGIEACFVIEAGQLMEARIARKDIGVNDYIELQSNLDLFLFQNK